MEDSQLIKTDYHDNHSLIREDNWGIDTASDIDSFVENLQEHFIHQARKRYSEVVVEHWLHPRNQFAMPEPDGHARIKGPCGDTMDIFVKISGSTIADASFLTDGCITSIASASMAVEMAIGRSVAEAMEVSQDDILGELGGLPKESRHCALLASNTLREAVKPISVRKKSIGRKRP